METATTKNPRVTPTNTAFPIPDSPLLPCSSGIDIRTYLAALAIQGYLASGKFFHLSYTEIAEMSVVAADALIDELNK